MAKATNEHWKHRVAWSDALKSASSGRVIWAAGLAILVVWLAYAFRFAPDLLPGWVEHVMKKGLGSALAPIATMGDNDSWGQLGDFVGGVLNPLLSFLALMAIVKTMRLNAMQMEQSRLDQHAANTASQITALHSASEILTAQIGQMQSASGKGAPVDPDLYKEVMAQREQLTNRMLELSRELLKT